MKSSATVAFAGTLVLACTLWPAAGLTGERPAPTAREAAFADRLDSFVRDLRSGAIAPPGSVVAVVHDGKPVFERAYGFRDLATKVPMTLDTPVYIASVTKAYTGLLAAQLDAEGTLPLSASLADVWPGITLPPPLDPSRITAAKLLSHTAGFSAGGLIFRSVYTGQVHASDVPDHLARYAKPAKPEFEYGNIGPFVWSAMAETRTGIRWNDLLKRKTLAPLGLAKTSARLEDFAPGEVARCHVRRTGAWQPMPPKPTAVLNAAGGLYTSGRDAARFLQAFVSDGAPPAASVPALILRRTWQREATQDKLQWGMQRDGYGLGWDLGAYEEQRFVSRSGGYPGCRAIVMFLPERKLGIAVLSNGDVAANQFNAAVFGQAIDEWFNAPDRAQRRQQRIAEYAAVAGKAVVEADGQFPSVNSAATSDDLLRRAPGIYADPRLGDFQVSRRGKQLVLTGGAFTARLLPSGRDRFAVVDTAGSEPAMLEFERREDGSISGFLWDDDSYLRIDHPAPMRSSRPAR